MFFVWTAHNFIKKSSRLIFLDISSSQGLLRNEPLDASALGLQIQTMKSFTHEQDTPVDSTKTETRPRSDENAVNPAIKVTSPSSKEAARNSTTVTTSAEKTFASTIGDFGNTTVTSIKKDFSNNEAVTEFDCRQLKNRTSVSIQEFFYSAGKKK